MADDPGGPDGDDVSGDATRRSPDSEFSTGDGDSSCADDDSSSAEHKEPSSAEHEEPPSNADTLRPDGGGEEVEPIDPYGPPPGDTAGAPDDQEMPLGDHIEEMIRRLGWVIVAMAVVSGLTFPFADRLINFLWYSFLPGSPEVCPTTGDPDAACPYIYHPLSLMFARLKVASLVGFVAALPVMVYQSYLFMRPGLYPRERRYYLASVPTSLVLATVGVGFAYLLVLPTLFLYFTGYTAQAAEVAFGLSETFNLIVMMMGFFALVFQIPLLIMLAVMMGVTSHRWLADRRIYFWGGFATIAFLFSPDPTGMAPIMVAATMIVLFEGTLLLLHWTGQATTLPTATSLAARRPFAWLAIAVAGYVASSEPLPGSYYGRLPSVVTDALADLGATNLTPLLVGGGLIALYEGGRYLYRRVGSRRNVWLAIARLRAFVWPTSLIVGYLASPDPALVRRVDVLDLPAVEAAAAAVGLIVAYEVAIVVLRWRGRVE